MLSYFLIHSGLDLSEPLVGALVWVTSRAVQATKELEPQQLVEAVALITKGHREPKLKPHHAGPMAQYLVRHPDAGVEELLSFIETELCVEIERHTLTRVALHAR